MAWNYDDEEINGVIDSNIKDSPPNPPAVNSAATIRSALKLYWEVIRSQVSRAVNDVDAFVATTLTTVNNALSGVETRIAAAEAKNNSIYEQFSLADGLGTYNALTGIATIKETGATFTPVLAASQAKGKFFSIDVEGTQSVTGISRLLKVGGVLISRGTKWDYIPPADTGYSKVVSLEETFQSNAFSDKLLPVFDNVGKLITCIELDGSFFAGWYKDNSINGSGLKNSEITISKLHQEVLNLIGNGTVANASITLNKLALETVNAFLSSAYLDYLFPLRQKKLVTLGDSITAGCAWQPLLAQLTGLNWSETETKLGTNGNPKMGIGGSRIVPEILAGTSGRAVGESIYYRAGFAHLYSPDIIILFGGQNDPTSSSAAVLGTIADPPYTGGEIVQGEAALPTFYSAYKGTLLKLLTNNPNAKIYAMTRMWNGTTEASFTEANFNATMNINTAIKTICARYSVQVIDLHQEIGITPYNASTFYSDTVHPNALGGQKMARLIASKIN